MEASAPPVLEVPLGRLARIQVNVTALVDTIIEKVKAAEPALRLPLMAVPSGGDDSTVVDLNRCARTALATAASLSLACSLTFGFEQTGKLVGRGAHGLGTTAPRVRRATRARYPMPFFLV